MADTLQITCAGCVSPVRLDAGFAMAFGFARRFSEEYECCNPDGAGTHGTAAQDMIHVVASGYTDR